MYKNENDLPIDYLLISETDEKGTIVYINDYFAKISGWSVDQLLGKSHNIIRHQDMKKSIFKELWKTIKEDKIWSGYIKNRNKNGHYYWVHAIIFPITLENNAKGYRCRRRQASQDEIIAVEKEYERLGE